MLAPMPVFSNQMPLGSALIPFSLPGTDGKTYSDASFKDARVLVVIFTCNHCPYAKAVEDRLVAIQRDYRDKGVALVAINPNDATKYPEDGFDAMKVRATEKSFNFPYLRDETQAIARAYDAACTPDLFVFDESRHLVYNGRIDDNWKEPENVTKHELRELLDATLAGTQVDFEHVPSMGCSIKWLP